MSVLISIPVTAIISENKVRDYLLKPQQRNDKSGFLKRAGYHQDNWRVLYNDIKALLPVRAEVQSQNEYGDYYSTATELTGPNGVTIRVKIIWMRDQEGLFRFITLVPL